MQVYAWPYETRNAQLQEPIGAVIHVHTYTLCIHIIRTHSNHSNAEAQTLHAQKKNREHTFKHFGQEQHNEAKLTSSSTVMPAQAT